MRAAVIHAYGDPDVLQIAHPPMPDVNDWDLLVRVRASSINPLDWKIRQGRLRLLAGFSFPKILGADIAGEIVATGDKVQGFEVGDPVYAMLNGLKGGAYAEYAAVPARNAALKPPSLTFEEAAATPLAALTALQALRDKASVASNHHVLINGASGGVGSFAVQLADHMGGRVTGVASGPSQSFLYKLGVQHAINYEVDDFVTLSEAYDAIFDVAGTCNFMSCRRVLRPRGSYVTTAPSAASIMWEGLTAFTKQHAYVMRVQPSGADLRQLSTWMEMDAVRPAIDSVFPLSDIAAAHRHCENDHMQGKVVITMME